MEPKAKRTVNPLATLAELYPDVRVAAYARRPYQTGWRVTLDARSPGLPSMSRPRVTRCIKRPLLAERAYVGAKG